MNKKHPAKVIPLLDAVREMSRSAHRWRDRASHHYTCAAYGRASKAKKEKEKCYDLKDRGIIALHHRGELRYAGASPQGMAIYEYGDGGMQCLHSTLYPVGAERTLVPDHPETLLVPAKKQRVRICDAEYTIVSLPEPDRSQYDRSESPRIRRTITCYTCGEEGHIARECMNGYYSDDDDDDYEMYLYESSLI